MERLEKGREERARKGRPPGGTVPYGYYRKNKKWRILPSEAVVVRQIFKLSKNSEKPFKIAHILNSQGQKRRNGKEWVGQQVKEILSRGRLYQEGIVNYGEARGQNKKLIILGND